MVYKFNGKKAIITGGSAGIGKEIASSFNRDGAKIALIARTPEKLDAAKADMPSPDMCVTVPGDISTPDGVTTAIKKAIELLGGVDILVNCAGTTQSRDHPNHNDPEAYSDLIWYNTLSAAAAINAAEDGLVASKGCVVNISTVASQIALPTMSPYTVSKAALDQLSRDMALKFAPKGVRVNVVSPGAVDTDLLAGAGEQMGVSREQFLSMVAKSHPIGRAGQPQEIASAVAFLCSEGAGFITGVNLPVDGGLMLTNWFNLGSA